MAAHRRIEPVDRNCLSSSFRNELLAKLRSNGLIESTKPSAAGLSGTSRYVVFQKSRAVPGMVGWPEPLSRE